MEGEREGEREGGEREGGDVAMAVIRECPFGLLWNPHARLCDLFHRVRLANGEVKHS